MNKTIITLISIWLPVVAQAQDFKLLEVEYGHYPKAAIRETTGDQEMLYREFASVLRIPVVSKNKKTVLINSLSYGLVKPEVVNAVVDNAEGSLHYIAYGITWMQTLNDKLRLITTFTPAISSSLNESLNSDDLLFLGSAIINKRVSETFSWGLGVAYTSRFGEPIAIPMIQIQHQKDNFKLDAIIPNKIEATWEAKNKRTRYGFRIRLRGSQFNLHVNEDNPIDNIRFSRANLGPVFTRRIKGPVHFSLFSGFSVSRRHELISESLGNFDFSAENGFFMNFGLFFSPQPKD